ncbi:MAG: SGNH/GDSL hydrolase family protein [Candidatus Aenigmarchaeota archaeon]|nr:SGNH/GDSL hydrolase family protein [Candidatus Aenigmarchaeota archaeon]
MSMKKIAAFLKDDFTKKEIALIIITAIAMTLVIGRYLEPRVIVIPTPKEIILQVAPSETQSNLSYYYMLRPGAQEVINNRLFGSVAYSINSDGLRASQNYSREKPDSTFRIALFGDSYTFGQFLNANDTMADVLQGKLNLLNCTKKVETLNFGVPGYDFPYSVELFLGKGRYYNPDISIFSIKNDDIDIINEIQTPMLAAYSKARPAAGQDSETAIVTAEQAMQEYFTTIKDYNKTIWLGEYAEKPLKAIAAGAPGSELVIFSYFNAKQYDDFLRNRSSALGLRFVSMDDHDAQYRSRWNAEFSILPSHDRHPNAKGNQYLADFLQSYLTANGLVPCS